jgi:uncharacterized lipoprotein YddW (UPF0748 family)
MNIVDEVVTKYDIDAIHFDYFYPYRITGRNFPIPPTKIWQRLKLEDWRRDNTLR